MGRVFSQKDRLWYRLWVWLQLLPSHIWPKPIESAPLTEEELEMLKELEREDAKPERKTLDISQEQMSELNQLSYLCGLNVTGFNETMWVEGVREILGFNVDLGEYLLRVVPDKMEHIEIKITTGDDNA